MVCLRDSQTTLRATSCRIYTVRAGDAAEKRNHLEQLCSERRSVSDNETVDVHQAVSQTRIPHHSHIRPRLDL